MAYPYNYNGYGYNPNMQPSVPAFACHPVTSREEAIAAPMDYFSAGLVMPDLGHGCIYLKRFNQNTGTSDVSEFRLVQNEAGEERGKFVTVAEFERFQKELARRMGGKIKEEVVEEYD